MCLLLSFLQQNKSMPLFIWLSFAPHYRWCGGILDILTFRGCFKKAVKDYGAGRGVWQVYSGSLKIYKLRYWGPWTINENSLAWLNRASGSKANRNIFKCSMASAYLASSDNHLCLPDICIIVLFLCCFSEIQGCWPLFGNHRQSTGLRGEQDGETKMIDRRAEKKDKGQGYTFSEKKHRGVKNQQGPDWGWKRWNAWWREAGARGKESVLMLIALIWRGWWTEDSTSALIQAHFPRTQLPDSQLSPPKTQKGTGQSSKGTVVLSAAVLLLSPSDVCWFLCRKGLEWNNVKTCLFFKKQLVPRLFRFYMTGASCSRLG